MPRGGKREGAGRKSKKVEAPEKALPRPAIAAVAPFTVIEGGDGRPAEPDWGQIFTDDLDTHAARQLWAATIRELKDSEKLATVNAHQIKRYVCACVLYEQASRHVAEEGAVFPRKGKKQPAWNPWFTVMKDANAMASAAEAELTITPRRRNNGGKVKPKARRTTAADEFLTRVAGRPGN